MDDIQPPVKSHVRAVQPARATLGQAPRSDQPTVTVQLRLNLPQLPIPTRAALQRQFKRVQKHRIRAMTVLALAVIVATELATNLLPFWQPHSYALGIAGSLLTPISQPMAAKLQFDNKGMFNFNAQYDVPGSADGQGSANTQIAASAGQDPERGINVIDPVNNVSFKLTPQFSLGPGQQDGNRVVYPLNSGNGWIVDSMHAIGVKEDVLLTKANGDTMTLTYKLDLGQGLVARLEANGDVGVYGSTLLSGSVATSTDNDAALLQKARASAPKTTILFRLPAPIIYGMGKVRSRATAKYTLHNDQLSVHVQRLQKAHYPLSIDPSVYVTSAQDFMRGNNETNIDFDVSDALIQKGVTTGARFNSWNSTLSLPAATWNGGTAVAGGYIYLAGGTASGGTTAAVYWAKFDTASNAITTANPGNGSCSSWCTNSAYNLLNARAGLSLVAYNGFLYALGGVDSTGALKNTVYIAKLGANGEPQLWSPSSTDKTTWTYWYSSANTLPDNIAYGSAVAYNNRLYILGGKSSTNPNGDAIVRVTNLNPTGDISAWSSTGMVQLSSGASARFGLSTQAYNDRLYVIGGNNAGTLKNDVYYMKLNTDGTMAASAWTQTNGFTTARMTWGGNFTTVWGAYIYLSGGCSAVNGSGYCTTVASDTQLASINADGSLDIWNANGGVSDTRLGYGLVAWRSVIYEIGGCSVQNTATGACTTFLSTANYGSINQDGDASTVATSVASGTAPCSGGSPINCSLPAAGSGSGQIGQMLTATAIINGFLYVIGGCTGGTNQCSTTSDNTAYVSISSTGDLTVPANCVADGNTLVGAWCVDNTHAIGGGVAAAGTAIFGGRIYVVGGLNGTANVNAIYYTTTGFNSDGSMNGGWTSQTMAGANSVAYDYAYARANPSAAGTSPGNLYIFGGCNASQQAGCTTGGSPYSAGVYKCLIGTTGAVTSCSTTSNGTQMQISDAINPADSSDCGSGLGAMAGTVYANYIYLIGGLTPNCTDLTTLRYAKFDNNNNVVAVSGSAWVQSTVQTVNGRRRGAAFGYNGYIYVVGGYDGTGGNILADIEFAKINVSDGSLVDQSGGSNLFNVSSVTLDQHRWGLSVPVSNSNAYVIGGCTSGNAPTCNSGGLDATVTTFQIYNNDAGTPAGYSTAANTYATNPNRLGVASAVLNGYIYAMGGCTSTNDCSNAVNTVSYAAIDATGAIGSWSSATAALPAVRTWGKLEVAGGSLYYLGGQDSTSTNVQTTVYYATPSSGNISSWGTATNGLPAARTKFGAAVWNNRIYVVGGLNTSLATTATIYVSPQQSSGGNISGSWSTSSTSLSVARYGAMVAAYANNLYTFGGNDGTNYLSDSQYSQLNASTGNAGGWTYTTNLPTQLALGDSFAVNGYMYIIGGRSTTGACRPITLVSPISANTTIASGNNPTGVGEWFETNQRYTSSRYGDAAAYNDGKAYILGGACASTTAPTAAITNTSTANTGFGSASTTHNVQMPATVAAGDLLLVFLSTDNNYAVTTAGGWTSLATANSGAGGVTGSVYAKVATGSEGGTQVNFTTGTGTIASAQTYRILAANWYGDLTNGVSAAAGTGATTQTPDPPALNPTNWDLGASLWIAYAAGSVYQSVTTYPTNYTNGTHTNSGTTTSDASVSTASRGLNASSEDPGTFTMNASQSSVPFTVSVRPPLAYAGSAEVQQSALLSQPQVAKYSIMMDTDSDVYPNIWLLNGVDNSIGARWQLRYRSMTNITTSCTSPAMTTWGQETIFGNVTLGTPGTYTPVNGTGVNTNCARFFYFFVSVDSSQAYGYPDDVSRGPTINDLTLGYTADPSKRLMHGRTFVGGLQQPDDTPCRQSSGYSACPLP